MKLSPIRRRRRRRRANLVERAVVDVYAALWLARRLVRHRLRAAR